MENIMYKTCSSLDVEIPKWDTSKMTELKSIEGMTIGQIKYCFENELIHNYHIIGRSAIIDSEIKEYFNGL